jgi:crotonobetainyl-CoA:carnitine CoA-transferase CaiB-like acyl-CoA transferase
MAPLTGVRVVDFSTMVAVPLATSMLAENGADVIKVEALGGDGIRRFGTPCEDISTLFMFLNRGKRSIAVDMKTPQGLQCVRRLVTNADVVVHQFRPGVAERLGVGYEEVCKLSPTVVYAQMTGFGDKGPFAGTRAYDPTLQAYSGISSMQGGGGPPEPVATPIPDKLSGLVVAYALMVGLAERARTNASVLVQSSMLQSLMWWMWSDLMRQRAYALFDSTPMTVSNAARKAVFQTSDGRYLSIWAMSDADFRALAIGLGREDLAEDPRFATAEARNPRLEEMVEAIREEVAKHTFRDLDERLRASDAVWAPVNDAESLLHDEQVLANNMYVEFEHGAQGTVRQAPLPFRLNGEISTVLPVPRLGEHTAQILKEVDYSDSDIESLVVDGVVRCHAE